MRGMRRLRTLSSTSSLESSRGFSSCFTTGRGQAGSLNHDFASQQYLQHTPLITAVAVVFSVVIAGISGALAFGIFRRSRFAVVAMLVFVILLQFYTWFVARSPAGTIVSIVVVGFLLRGARRIFQDHAERRMGAEKLN
jgi:hypothetical protein